MKSLFTKFSTLQKLLIMASITFVISGGSVYAFKQIHAANKSRQEQFTVLSNNPSNEGKQKTSEVSSSVPTTTEPSTQTLGAGTATPASPTVQKSTSATPQQPVIARPKPVLDRSELIAACNTVKQSWIDSYSIYQNQITAQHQSRLSAIQSDYLPRGLGFSGMYQSAVDSENTLYQQYLANFEVTYQQKLDSYNCV